MKIDKWSKGEKTATVTFNKKDLKIIEKDFEKLNVGDDSPDYEIKRRIGLLK